MKCSTPYIRWLQTYVPALFGELGREPACGAHRGHHRLDRQRRGNRPAGRRRDRLVDAAARRRCRVRASSTLMATRSHRDARRGRRPARGRPRATGDGARSPRRRRRRALPELARHPAASPRADRRSSPGRRCRFPRGIGALAAERDRTRSPGSRPDACADDELRWHRASPPRRDAAARCCWAGPELRSAVAWGREGFVRRAEHDNWGRDVYDREPQHRW